MENNTVVIHKFEAAGLGSAPFRFARYEMTNSRAAACDFCGTHIMHIYWIDSTDSKRSKVGSECIKSAGDAGLMRIVEAHEREARRRKALEKSIQVNAELNAIFADNITVQKLKAMPHPYYGYTERGFSRYDSVLNRYKWSGKSGRATLLKELKALFAAAPVTA